MQNCDSDYAAISEETAFYVDLKKLRQHYPRVVNFIDLRFCGDTIYFFVILACFSLPWICQ